LTEPNKVTATLARAAIGGTAFFAIVMFVAFLFIEPDLNPLHRFGSEYAVGQFGWLMKTAFFVWGTGLVCFAVAMHKGIDAGARSNIAVSLFLIGAVGIFFSGIWDTDLLVLNDSPPPLWIEPPSSPENDLHNVAGFTGLISLMVGAGIATRHFPTNNRLRGRYVALRYLSWAVPSAFVAFATFFVPFGLAGLGQRIFLLLMFSWVIGTAFGISKGAFKAGE
jgi:hypothetical protein